MSMVFAGCQQEFLGICSIFFHTEYTEKTENTEGNWLISDKEQFS